MKMICLHDAESFFRPVLNAYAETNADLLELEYELNSDKPSTPAVFYDTTRRMSDIAQSIQNQRAYLGAEEGGSITQGYISIDPRTTDLTKMVFSNKKSVEDLYHKVATCYQAKHLSEITKALQASK